MKTDRRKLDQKKIELIKILSDKYNLRYIAYLLDISTATVRKYAKKESEDSAIESRFLKNRV